MQTDKTFRVRILQKSGTLARLIIAMSKTGVMFNNIETKNAGRQYLYRDITVEVDNEIQYHCCPN